MILHEQSILVTGGAGAFGRAFVLEALAQGARRVVVFSRDEAKQAAFRASCPDPRVRWFVGDVRDYARVFDALRGVDVVVHAAAMKRIESCQSDPVESRKTNIEGTDNVARACVERGVKRAVYLSTDKAAAATTVYGAHKMAAERSWCQANVYAAGTPTRFAATRYGNVANSTGSVIPLWREQQAFGFVTITDPRMTRFLMTMADAVELVCSALRYMQGGEVFIPKLRGARMVDLAGVVAPGCVQRPIGLRGVEKLHESLVESSEVGRMYDCGDHYVIRAEGAPTPLYGVPVPPDFVYDSNQGEMMDVSELTRVAA